MFLKQSRLRNNQDWGKNIFKTIKTEGRMFENYQDWEKNVFKTIKTEGRMF